MFTGLVEMVGTIERVFPHVLEQLLAFSRAVGGPAQIMAVAAQLEDAVESATPERNT